MDKKLSASRGLHPADPQQGLCLCIPLEAPTPDSRYRLELRADQGPPPLCQILDPPLHIPLCHNTDCHPVAAVETRLYNAYDVNNKSQIKTIMWRVYDNR